MKKLLNILPLIALLIMISSCSSVRVAADYDKNAILENTKPLLSLKQVLTKQKLVI